MVTTTGTTTRFESDQTSYDTTTHDRTGSDYARLLPTSPTDAEHLWTI